ncbi:MAG: PKD domain-containing protein [Deltaproteobacteria bacterium]|nr:PKD domain-containing protein [Deltaproteobacteria bacterium]
MTDETEPIGIGDLDPPAANQPPVADAGPGKTVFVGDTVTLDGSGSSDGDGDALTFSWSLTTPTGSTATLSDPTAVNPTFEVDVFGTYVAQLVVNDGSVDSAPSSANIDTENSAPVADAGQNPNVVVGETVTLDGSGSSDVDGDALTFSWSLSAPAGSTATLSDSTAVTPSFVADVAGTYAVQLIVNDGTVDSEAAAISVTAADIQPPPNTTPVADAGQNQSLPAGETVYLDGSNSSDADSGDQLTYLWSFVTRPVGSSATFSDPLAVDPTFVADVAGAYTVQLIVNDGTVDSEPDTVLVTAAGDDSPVNTPPVADAGQDQNLSVGSTVALDGNGSIDADGDAITFSWTFSSVPAGSTPMLSDPSAANPTFTADAAGEYMVQLIVHDGTADSAPDAVVITAQAAPQNPGEPTPPPTGGDEIEEEDRDDEDELDDDDDEYEPDDEESEKSGDRGKRYGRKKPFKNGRQNDRDDD